jgi:hypothetical protein
MRLPLEATMHNPIVRLFALFLAGILAACGGGGGGGTLSDPPAVVTPAASQVPNEIARSQVLVSGQTEITIPSGSALAGTKITIPKDAARAGTLDVQVGYLDAPPGPVGGGATAVSKTLVIKVIDGGPSEFRQLITITMPYDKAAAGGVPPSILYWDEEQQVYSPVSVIAVDEAAGTVTFRTSHFSSFVAVVIRNLAQSLGVDTGFRIGVDTILHQNFGSYEFGGHCMAFASMSSFYFSQKKAKKLFDFAQEDLPNQPADDEVTRTALAVTYGLLASKWNSIKGNVFNTPARLTGLLMIQAMKATGKPVHFVMQGKDSAGKYQGHAVTAYGYDATKKEFLIYDSNFPLDAVTLPWNLVDGFGQYSKFASYDPGLFDDFGFTSDDTFGAPSSFRRIITNWEAGKLKDAFANLQVTDETGTARQLAVGANVRVQVAYADNQKVVGKFNRPAGSVNPVHLHVFQDGVAKGSMPIAGNGEFTLNFPTKLEARTELMLLVSEDPLDEFVGFSAYGKFTVQPQGKNFFVNFGFETGDMTGWTGATSFLPQAGGTYTGPNKLAVVSLGFDPIATTLPRVVFGSNAIRVNDSTPDYHTTFLAQTATVPASGNPQLNFKWAAVLEDPQHSANEQPFVEVSVRNVTRNIDLYRKRFYTNDPTYGGWKSYQGGDWKAIEWQTVTLGGLSQYAGEQIELRIVGADCTLGGHGGYVYLDGEE